jgi:predicted P-loop ATPase
MKKNKFTTIEEYLNEKYIFRSNTINQKIEVATLKKPTCFTEINEADLLIEINKESRSFSMQDLKVVLQSSLVQKFNPIHEYFLEVHKKFEDCISEENITKLSNFIVAEDQENFNYHFKKMLVRCVACSLDSTIINKQVFVLVQIKQDSGKSTFLRFLCPLPLREYYTEELTIDKDGLIALSENFFINLDELSTISKAEINAIKSYISKDKIKVRPPYGSKTITANRIANFVGSTNLDEFLIDNTGNVRWLCFKINGINWKYMEEIDINKVWAEAYDLYKKGFEFKLSPTDIAKNELNNTQFLNSTSEFDYLTRSFLPGSKEAGDEFKTTTEILDCLVFEHSTNQRLNSIQLGKALSRAGFQKEQVLRGSYQVKGYYVKPNLEIEKTQYNLGNKI